MIENIEETERMDMSLDDLFSAIKAWGREHGVTDPAMQYAKINEEVGELAHELTRGRCSAYSVPSREAIDAIGDILVTVIIFANIVGIDPHGALNTAYSVIKDRKGHSENGVFIKEAE